MKNKVIKTIAIILIILTVLTGAFLVGGYFWLVNSDDYVQFDAEKLNNINNTLTMLDANEQPIASSVYINGYKQVTSNTLNQYTLDAFVSIEDKRFYQHKGLDYKRIVGALISNIKSGSYKEGASTISQQLIKNTHLDNEKTIKRKLNEMLLARQLEKQFTKRQILEMYVNTIYFGHSAYGIESASKSFFNKSASGLTLGESAMLAGIIKSPANYSPINHYDNCISRRNVVLGTMKSNGLITQEQYNQATSEQPIINKQSNAVNQKDYYYAVVQQACELLNMSQIQLFNANVTIHTYYDQTTQQALEEAINIDNTTYADGQSLADCLGIITDNATCGIQAFYSRGNRSINQKRQIGSTIKPFAVYAPAMEEKQITQASMILDEQTNFSGYQPHNYGNSYKGWITVKEALKRSSNVCAVKTLNNLGIDNSCKYLQKMNINVDAEQNLSLALGNINGGMTATELMQCYVTLANQGVYNDVSFIKSITNAKGKIYEHKLNKHKVFSQQTDFLITDMLRETATSGTAKALKSNYQIAGKTGTVGNSNGNSDAIVSGYTTEHTFCVWLSGQNKLLENSITGGNAPCKIAKQVLDTMYQNNKPKEFDVPQGVIKQSIDKVALINDNQLLIAGADIPSSEKLSFYFAKNNCASKVSDRYLLKMLDIEVSYQNGIVNIKLPQKKYTVKVYKVDQDGAVTQLHSISSSFIVDMINNNGTYSYYAEIYLNEQLLQKTNTHIINVTDIINNADNNEKLPNADNTGDTQNTPPSTDKDKSPNEDKKHSWILDWFYPKNKKGRK